MSDEKQDDLLWVEKYRPKTVNECILPDRIKQIFLNFVSSGNLPNLLLSGGPGIGKTTIARALCNDMGYEYILINASDERNIDTVRGVIRQFSSTMSLEGKPKAIILDEADGLNPNSAQPALRAAIEEFSHMRFILTCNTKNKLIPAIHSRTSTVEFNLQADEKESMKLKFLMRVFDILKKENIKFDQKVVGQIIKKFYPDNRRILNDLQKYSAGGEIDSGILVNTKASDLDALVKAMKEKSMSACRQWVANNVDTDPVVLFREIYDKMLEEVNVSSIPGMVLVIADYQYKSAFVADQEINTMALVMSLLGSVEFK